jgi:hypothetical protein
MTLLLFIGIFSFLLVYQWNAMISHIGTGFDLGYQRMETMVAQSDSLHFGRDLMIARYDPLSWFYKGVQPAIMLRETTITIVENLPSLCIASPASQIGFPIGSNLGSWFCVD